MKARKEDFFDMERELQELLRELADPLTRMVVIKGVRRVGKSSLLRVALNELRKPYVLLDLRAHGVLTPEAFYEEFSRALSRLLERERGLASLLSRVRGVEVAGLRVEIAEKGLSTVVEVLDELNEWSQKIGEQVLLVFDEAQDLRLMRGFDRLLAHIYDYKRGLKLVLAGSEVGLLDRLLGRGKPKAPLFGRACFELTVKRFPLERAEEFLKRGFEEAGVKVGEGEIAEAVEKLDGVVGWLTYYGYYRLKMSHREALKRTLSEGAALTAEELKHFLAVRAVAKRRYLEILRALTRPSRWSDVKRFLAASLGERISDKQLSNYLRELLDYGFIERVGEYYVLADPLIAEAFAKGLLR